MRQLPDSRMHQHIKIMWHCALPLKVKKWMTRLVDIGLLSWDDLLQVRSPATSRDLPRPPTSSPQSSNDLAAISMPSALIWRDLGPSACI